MSFYESLTQSFATAGPWAAGLLGLVHHGPGLFFA